MQRKGTRNHIFAGYQLLIELNIVGHYLYLILLFIEAAQLLFFPFNLPQDSSTLFQNFESVLKFTLITPYIFDSLGETAFLLTWAIFVFILTITAMVLCVVVVKYKDPRKKPLFIGKMLINGLTVIMAMLKTVLVVPLSFTFSVPLVCTQGYECWKGDTLPVSIVSSICLLLTLFLLFACELYSDSYINSTLPWTGPCTNSGIYMQLIKFGLGFILAVDYEMRIVKYVFIVLIICCLCLVYQLYYSLLFYRSSINYMECFKLCTFLSSLVAMYANSLEGSYAEIDVCIVAICLGIALGWVLCHQRMAKVVKLLQNGAILLGPEEDAVNAFSMLTRMKGKNLDFFPLLAGPLAAHRPKCRNERCVCRYFDKNADISGLSPHSRQESRIIDESNISRISEKGDENESRWFEFIGVLLDEAVGRYAKSVNLRLLVAYYQEYRNKNFYKSFFQLLKAVEKGCSYLQQLAIYRMTVLLNKHICADESATSVGSIDIDIDLFVSIEEKRRQFEVSIQECTQRVAEFWGLLLSVNLRIDKMYLLGGKISASFKTVHDYFNEIISIFPDHVKTYLLYSMFLKEVANSEIEAEEYQDKAHQILKSIDNTKRQAHSVESTFSVNRETAIVIISGDLNNLGIILSVNEDTQQIFGYSYNELVGSSVNKLMPKILAASHDKFLLKFYETGKHVVLNKERLLFGQSKNGLLVPIAILVKTMPGLENGLKYISFIRKDLSYIKKDLIKLPYQYQSQKAINFIMTDSYGNIQGISEYTSKTIGIPLKYFERKRTLFAEALNIRQLNSSQLTQEMDEQLRKGVVMDLNVVAMFSALDKDFLTLEEIEVLDKRKTHIDVHIQLMDTEVSHSEAEYKIYVFVKLKSGEDATAQIRKNDDDLIGEEMNQLEMLGDVASSSASSSLCRNDKIRVVVKELKKNIFEHSESLQIRVLKRLLYLGFFALFAISVADVWHYVTTLATVKDLAMLGESAHLRSNLVSTMLEQLLSYRDLAMGKEQNSTTYEPNREASLKHDLEYYIEKIKNNEYLFQNKLANINVDKIYKIYIAPGVTIKKVQIDCNVILLKQGLDITFMQLVSKASRLVSESSLESFNSNFMREMYDPIDKSKCEELTQTDKDMYFVMINGLYHLFNATTVITDNVMESFTKTVTDERELFLILHAVRFSIVLALIVVAIPIVLQVQRGKRAILRLFAEVSRGKIEDLVKQCEHFSNAAKKSVEGIYKREKMPSNSKEPSPDAIDKTPTAIHSKKSPGSPTNADKGHIKTEETSQELAENLELNVDDEAFKEERRKKFLSYSAGLGWIFLSFVITMFLLTCYGIGICVLQYLKYNLFSKNYELINVLQRRWFYFSSSMIYTLSSTEKTQIMDETLQKPQFEVYSEKIVDIEKEVDLIKYSHPSNQDKLADILLDLLETDYCGYLIDNSMVNTTRISLEWCHSIRDSMLKHGMKPTIFFIMSELQNKVRTVHEDEAVLENKLIYENILVPTYTYMAKLVADSWYKLIDNAKPEIIAHYLAISLMMLIAVLFLKRYFAEKLNEELRSAKGIVSLLPLELIYNNRKLARLFHEQMNIMV